MTETAAAWFRANREWLYAFAFPEVDYRVVSEEPPS